MQIRRLNEEIYSPLLEESESRQKVEMNPSFYTHERKYESFLGNFLWEDEGITLKIPRRVLY